MFNCVKECCETEVPCGFLEMVLKHGIPPCLARLLIFNAKRLGFGTTKGDAPSPSVGAIEREGVFSEIKHSVHGAFEVGAEGFRKR